MASVVYVPGAGKSAVRRELRRRGFAAFGTDEDGLAALFDRSGTMVPAEQVVDATLQHRLASRTGNDFGKSPDELAEAIGWLRGYADDFLSYGAHLVDATEPIQTVVDSILTVTAELDAT